MSRRNLLGGLAVLAITPGAVLTAQAATADTLDRRPAPNRDAELIRICAEHNANREAYCAYGGHLEQEDDPLWLAYERTRDAIAAAVPVTLAGMVAKARAAKAEAQNTDGTENPRDCPAGDWAWQLVSDLLRLEGGA
ncbi:MAG TPA: hypothetical protein VIL69_13850 [Roseomonas sp.]|jgi:hypothetical protein